MKKDIPRYKVEDVAIAIVPEGDQPDAEVWDVYLLNLKDTSLASVLINSKGYGEIGGRSKTTTVLRHYFEQIKPLSWVKIEPIQRSLIELTNEYWLSFVWNGYMYDKKYIFVKGSIANIHFTPVPLLERPGVMIK